MKITKHISFYYNSNRVNYINRIITECNSYPFTTDIFIHTNYNFSYELLHEYNNGKIQIVVHDLSNINPFYLTWKCRDLLKNHKDDYDIFMYIEDDILVPKEAIIYWLKYNEKLIARNYNLGFVRIETLNGEEYITDLHKNEYLTKYLENIGDDLFVINDKNPYCAFWIYNKHEFNKFINSDLYNIQNIKGYLFREASAIGLHGLETDWYKHTIIPVITPYGIENTEGDKNTGTNNIKYQLHPSCRIYHLPNNYVSDNSNTFATIKFVDSIV